LEMSVKNENDKDLKGWKSYQEKVMSDIAKLLRVRTSYSVY
jgi:hypothetical protein